MISSPTQGSEAPHLIRCGLRERTSGSTSRRAFLSINVEVGMKLLSLVAVILLVVGCSQNVAGQSVPEPQRLDCDLIFPGPDGR